MRLAVFLLLFANALLFAYARIDGASVSEAGRLAEQVHPDSIKLLTPREVAALGLDRGQGAARAGTPPQTPPGGQSQAAAQTPTQAASQGSAQAQPQAPSSAAPADVCVQWGPFSDVDRAKAQADLDPLKLGHALSQRQVIVTDAWWVSLGPIATRAAADRRVADLRAQAIDDLSVVDTGDGQFAVSLGIFRTQDAASVRVQALAARGVAGARAAPNPRSITKTMLVVRNPPTGVAAKLEALRGKYPGSELRTGPCT
ncbi:MAG TPA: SPOR domain-containing protein [Casimicrobiaceae bacterium]|nr:SPOR domain-containing protein [Casimicrobiaceae bacterium]